MKKTVFFCALIACFMAISCNMLGKKSMLRSKDALANFVTDLKEQYGSKNGFNPAFQTIMFFYDPRIGDIVSVSGSSSNKSTQLAQKTYTMGQWKIDDRTVTIKKDNPEDILFTLDEVDLSKIPDIAINAEEFVKTKYNYSEVNVTEISLISTTGKKDLIYNVTVTTDNGKTYKGTYELSGKAKDELIKN